MEPFPHQGPEQQESTNRYNLAAMEPERLLELSAELREQDDDGYNRIKDFEAYDALLDEMRQLGSTDVVKQRELFYTLVDSKDNPGHQALAAHCSVGLLENEAKQPRSSEEWYEHTEKAVACCATYLEGPEGELTLWMLEEAAEEKGTIPPWILMSFIHLFTTGTP